MISLLLSLALFVAQSTTTQIQTLEERVLQAATTAPTSRPVVVVQAPTTQASVESDWMQVLRGEKQFDIRDALRPQYWVSFAQDLIWAIVGFIPRLLSAIFLFFLFWLLYRALRKFILGSLAKAGMDPSIRDMLASILRWAVLGFGLIIAFNQIGVQIAALLTGVSIVGLAIGFAAQESLQNFIAGIVIFWDQPFRIGDWIEIDNKLCQVRRVTFRSTRLNDLDGDVVIFPNTFMLTSKIINKTTNPITRINVMFGIAYKDSIDVARATLVELVKNDPRVEKSPAPHVVVVNLNASSVDLMLRFWIREEREENAVKYEYLERGKLALDAAGIDIPFPHVQLVVPKDAPTS